MTGLDLLIGLSPLLDLAVKSIAAGNKKIGTAELETAKKRTEGSAQVAQDAIDAKLKELAGE